MAQRKSFCPPYYLHGTQHWGHHRCLDWAQVYTSHDCIGVLISKVVCPYCSSRTSINKTTFGHASLFVSGSKIKRIVEKQERLCWKSNRPCSISLLGSMYVLSLWAWHGDKSFLSTRRWLLASSLADYFSVAVKWHLLDPMKNRISWYTVNVALCVYISSCSCVSLLYSNKSFSVA